jgi:hypothetical protein
MVGCEYFIAKTFAHLLGGLVVTGVSVENPIISNIDKKPLTNLLIFLFCVCQREYLRSWLLAAIRPWVVMITTALWPM